MLDLAMPVLNLISCKKHSILPMFHKFRRESSRELNHDFFSSYIKHKHSSIYASVPNHITFVTYLSFLCFF